MSPMPGIVRVGAAIKKGEPTRLQTMKKEKDRQGAPPNLRRYPTKGERHANTQNALCGCPIGCGVEVAVQFKAVAGRVDQDAGLVVRFQDKENYYITRANALENNVRLYKVVKGARKQFAGANVQVAAGNWHTLKLAVQGTRFQAFFDERLVFAVTDKTFKGAGKVGLWTKADSVTYFDNLSIMSHDTR